MVFTALEGLQGPVTLEGVGSCLCIHPDKIIARIGRMTVLGRETLTQRAGRVCVIEETKDLSIWPKKGKRGLKI